MQVINPRRKKYQVARRKQKKLGLSVVVLTIILIALIGAGFYLLKHFQDDKSDKQNLQANSSQETVQNIFPEKEKSGVLKNFSGEEFKNLYNSFAYPNTRMISDTTSITGNEAADHKIRQLAIARGYAIRSAPVSDTFEDFNGELLQQKAAQSWKDLVADAQNDGYNFGLTAGYRSADVQKDIFMSRLMAKNVNIAAIPSGVHDVQINEVLKTTAIPGYSRHHSGYTVDIACKNMPAAAFKNSSCFRWLSADNYKNAKENGWIPSYPDGAGIQGPDPEEWEYVWVGKDALYE